MSGGRQRRRALVVAGCVLALATAAALLPAIATSFQGPPGVSLFQESDLGAGGADSLGAGQLGALNPGSATTVGGLDDAASQSLRALGPQVHFTVESDRPAYWRTGAYGEYTGSGWERSGDQRPYDGPLSVPGAAGDTVRYRVELNRSARAVPTVWRPRAVAADPSLVVTDRRAVEGADRLPKGTVIEGTSVRPPDDPTVLSTAGRDYPEAVRERYTQLPAGTPYRLEGFTDSLTAEAENPYEAARAIEQWLEANKSYSLNASAPGGDDVASTFVFDMDRGYCEYFATSMVAMLRTQDVPARYVVGYSTGQPTGENTYTVRGMNAHAWVEVYFPETGWVRFDPTPGGPRLAVEQAAIQRDRPDALPYNHTEVGSPGETEVPDPDSVDLGAAMPDANVTAGNVTAPDTDGTTPGDDGLFDRPTEEPTGTDEPFTPEEVPTVTSEEDPRDDLTPGEDPTDPDDPGGNDSGGLDIELASRPVPGTELTVTVTEGGQPVSDAQVLFDGEPVGRTGYGGSVTGTVPYTEQLNVTVVGGETRTDAASASLPPPDGRLYAIPGPALRQDNGTRTVDVETNATLSLSGTVATGQSVLVTASVDGVPVRNATVRLDGEPIGATDERGQASVALPDRPGDVTLSVVRDPVAGQRTLSLRALSVDVSPSLPLALPWTEAEVTATLGNETVANAPVTVGGQRVGTTGIDGSLSTQLPLSGSARITVSQYGQTAAATLEGLWRNLAVVAGLLAVLGSAVGLVVRRVEASPDDVRSVLSRTVAVLLATADGLLAAGRTARRRAADLLAGRTSPGELWAGLRAWLAGIRGRGSEDGAATGPDRSAAARAIRTAWGVFLSEVSVRDPTTKTPGELATHAVEADGLPPDAVGTLRDAFRAVEYGDGDPSRRLSAVESAVEAITGGDEP